MRAFFVATVLLVPFASGATELDAHLVRTTWGVPDFEDPHRWNSWMMELVSGPVRYAGIEAPTWQVCLGAPAFSSRGIEHGCNETRVALFGEALRSSGLFYVAQIHTCGVPIQSADVDDHVASLAAAATIAKRLGARYVNVHDGVDFWSDDQVLAYFRGALEIEAHVGIDMSHETHRTRALATPQTTLKVLAA